MHRRPSPIHAALAALPLVLFACKTGSNDSAAPPPSASVAAPVPSTSATATPARCAARSPKRIERASAPGASSSIELVRAAGRTFALVADNDERALHVVDVEAMQEVSVTPLPGRPGHVLALADGRVAVALRDTARVLLLEPGDDALEKPFEERCAATLAAVEPWALAEAGERLLVSSGFGAALTLLRSGDMGVERAIPLPREPRAVVVANGGTTAFVAHAVGGIVSAVDLSDPAKAPETIALQAGRRILQDGGFDDKHTREASQGYALAFALGVRKTGERDVLRLYAPHTSVDPGAAAGGQSSGYGGPGPRAIAQIVSVIDPVAKKSITNHVDGAFHSHLQQDCLLPRSAVADENGVFVACLDIDAVLDLDPWIGDPSVGERRRFTLPAGPSALSLEDGGKRILAFSEIDRALSRIERQSGAIASIPLWRRAGEPRDAQVDRGRRLFHTSRDVRISQGRACASCHPEGRDDGLVWTSPDGPRQTLTLAGRLPGTAPYGWFGEHPTLRDHLKATFQRIGGTGFDAPQAAQDFESLIAYINQLPPPPTSPPSDAGDVERGKQVFTAYGCNGCHKDGGTDGRVHDVGSGVAGERHAEFDTPALRGIRATAPYFHDGRYKTLDEMLSDRNSRMFSGTLAGEDKRALITYLETL
jgi:mono/diheme cytochrome c family protein